VVLILSQDGTLRDMRMVTEQKPYRAHGIMNKVTNWIDGRGRNINWSADRGGGSEWHRGETSRGRKMSWHDNSPAPSRGGSSPDERRALRQLWQAKSSPVGSCNLKNPGPSQDQFMSAPGFLEGMEQGVSLKEPVTPLPS
jgi:hypothetical protein